jgi:hypothetical protein
MAETKVLEQAAQHFEDRAAELDEFYRRFGEKSRYQSAPLYAKADGFREAAVYLRTVAANGKAAAKAEAKAAQPTTRRRGRPPKPREPEAPTPVAPEPKPWEGASA